jgi:hypothetical protein
MVKFVGRYFADYSIHIVEQDYEFIFLTNE